jgi:hypothetical protein
MYVLGNQNSSAEEILLSSKPSLEHFLQLGEHNG